MKKTSRPFDSLDKGFADWSFQDIVMVLLTLFGKLFTKQRLKLKKLSIMEKMRTIDEESMDADHVREQQE